MYLYRLSGKLWSIKKIFRIQSSYSQACRLIAAVCMESAAAAAVFLRTVTLVHSWA